MADRMVSGPKRDWLSIENVAEYLGIDNEIDIVKRLVRERAVSAARLLRHRPALAVDGCRGLRPHDLATRPVQYRTA